MSGKRCDILRLITARVNVIVWHCTHSCIRVLCLYSCCWLATVWRLVHDLRPVARMVVRFLSQFFVPILTLKFIHTRPCTRCIFSVIKISSLFETQWYIQMLSLRNMDLELWNYEISRCVVSTSASVSKVRTAHTLYLTMLHPHKLVAKVNYDMFQFQSFRLWRNHVMIRRNYTCNRTYRRDYTRREIIMVETTQVMHS